MKIDTSLIFLQGSLVKINTYKDFFEAYLRKFIRNQICNVNLFNLLSASVALI